MGLNCVFVGSVGRRQQQSLPRIEDPERLVHRRLRRRRIGFNPIPRVYLKQTIHTEIASHTS